VLLPNTSPIIAREIAERLRGACEFPLKTNLDTFRISASLGIAYFAPGLKAEDLWRHAGLALGEAKQGGRNCVRHFCASAP
jgi:GGDEF domain-containing protein